MSWLEIHGNPNSGTLVLQHEAYQLQQFDLDYRAFKLAVRLVKRPLIKGIEFGQWQEDPDTRGDIIGGQVWFADYSKRPISAWRFAWPVTTTSGGSGTATPGAGGAACATQGQASMLPLWNPNYQADGRFLPVDYGRPEYTTGEKLHPKYAVGWQGISLTADNEDHQIEYFLPTDPRLVAVNREGDPEMGTNIVDMGPGFEVDPLRHARLHTFLRVIKGLQSPHMSFFNRNTIALNVNDSGCDDTRGGFWIDRPAVGPEGAVLPNARVIASWSHHEGGPIVAGATADKHNLGSDADANPFNSGHLWLEANWWFNEEIDAPFQFDGKHSYERLTDPESPYTPGTHWTDVRFEYDGEMSHDHPSGTKAGRFKWRAATIFYIPDDPDGPRVPPDPDDGPRVPPNPPELPPVTTPGRTSDDGEPERPDVPSTDKRRRPATPSCNDRRWFVAAVEDVAMPAILGRPQMVNDETWPDLRSPLNGGIPNGLMQRYDQRIPVVGRLEWMTSVTNNQINYTQRPRRGKGTRYLGGTAPGMLVLLPPEIDAADEDNSFAPNDCTLSPVSLGTIKETYFASGVPSTSGGGFVSGYRWTRDTSDRLVFERLDSSGVATNAVRFDQNGDLGIFDPDGGTNWGTQEVTRLTGDRQYTWPDRAGVVALQSGVGSFTAGSIPFADATGLLTEDNTNLSWDNSNDRLDIGVGSITVAGKTGQENVFNESGLDQDTRIEGLSEVNLLFVDASTDRLGFGYSTPEARLHVNKEGAGSQRVLVLSNYRSPATALDRVKQEFKMLDSGGAATVYADWEVLSRIVTAGSESSQFLMSMMSGGNLFNVLSIRNETGANRQFTNFLNNLETFGAKATAFVVNDTGRDYDFRVEGDTDTSLFHCDASIDGIGVFGSTAIAQPSSTGETTGFTAGTGTAVNDDSTFTGNVGATAYRISDIVKHLKNLGWIAV